MLRKTEPSTGRAWLAVVLFLIPLALAPGCKKRTGGSNSGGVDPQPQPACTTAPSGLSVDLPIGSGGSPEGLFIVGEPIDPILITSDGSCPAESFAISPALPDGLELTQDGMITGTPLTELPSTEYTLSGTNENGTSTITIVILIDPQAPTSLSYPDLLSVTIDDPIETVTPVTEGGPIDEFQIDVPLPEGLVLDSLTGEIFGTPVQVGVTAHEITAINVTGGVTDSIVIAVFPVPQVQGFARYDDSDRDGRAGPGDKVVVVFNQDIVVSGANPDDVVLAIPGNTFGSGASVNSGATPDELLITLGSDPVLKTRQRYDSGSATPNAASGLDIDPTAPDRIESFYTGSDAVPGAMIDVIPGFVENGATIDQDVTASTLLDVNNDGARDLITCTDGPNTVWTGLGDGSFSQSGVQLGSSTTSSVASGDFNHDGAIDVALGNSDPSGIEIWLGDGTGGFTLDASIESPNITTIVAFDVDNDGTLEIVGGEAVFEIQSGSLTESPFSAGSAITTIAFGDVDNDGDLDCYQGPSGHILLNDHGSFTAQPQDLPPSAVDSAFGDLDRDGDLDLCVAYGDSAQVWIGDGSGSFTLVQDLSDDARGSVLLSDVDRDGRLDAFFGDVETRSQLWIGEGDGTFIATESWVNGRVEAASDVDRDGDLDLLSYPTGSDDSAQIATGSITGTWGAAEFPSAEDLNVAADTLDLAVADLDGDGDLDFVAARSDYASGGAPNRVYLNDGSGSFTETTQQLGTEDTEDVVLIDIDRDGDLDCFTANRTSPNALYLNDGSGTFTESSATFPADDSSCLSVADFNGDGIDDLAVGNRGMNVIYFGDGDGGLTDSQQTLFAEFGGYTNDLATADIDHDGDIDLLEGTTLGRHNKIWFNDGLGQFSPGPDEFGAQEVQAIAIGDIDRDGNLDLIAGCAGVGSPFPNVILLGDGNGGFTESFEFPTPDTTTGVALTDVDEDGDLDLVVTNVGDNYLYHNDGLGNYGTPTIIGEDSSYSVEAADFDRDGDVDLLIGNRGSEDKLLRSK